MRNKPEWPRFFEAVLFLYIYMSAQSTRAIKITLHTYKWERIIPLVTYHTFCL